MRCTPRPDERVEVARQRGDERLALAGLHLRDPAEVQRGAAHDLDVEVALAEHPLAGLAHGRERLGEQVVEDVGDELELVVGVARAGLGPVDPGLELVGSGNQLFVGQPLDLGLECGDERDDRLHGLEPLALAGVENLLEDAHAGCKCTGGVGGAAVAGVARPIRPDLAGSGRQLASMSFSRTAYIAASVRDRSRSFSRMLRTWFFTVFSAITNWPAISLFDIPRATRRSTSTSRSVSLRLATGRVVVLDPTREHGELAQQVRDQRRCHQPLTAVRGPHRAGDLLDGHLFQQVAGRARAHRREEILFVVGAGEHHDLRVGLRVEDLLGRLDAGAAGHAHVHQHDVGRERERLLGRGDAVDRLADDLDVGFGREGLLEPVPEERVIVRDEDAYRRLVQCIVVLVVHVLRFSRLLRSSRACRRGGGRAPPRGPSRCW